MRALRKIPLLLGVAAIAVISWPKTAASDDNIVYSVYKNLDMGNPGEVVQRDYYLTMGTDDGLEIGSSVEVIRRAPTFDLTSSKLYKDVAFPIAKLKVIHVESSVAIARLDKFNAPEKTPALNTRAVMIGDLVRKAK